MYQIWRAELRTDFLMKNLEAQANLYQQLKG